MTAWTEGETVCWELPLEEPQIDALIEVLVRRKLKLGSPLAETLKQLREIQSLYRPAMSEERTSSPKEGAAEG